MKKIVFVIMTLMTMITTNIGAEIAEKPIFTPGDYWIFKNSDGKETKTVFLKEEKDYFIFNYNESEILYTTFNLTPIKRLKKETNEVVWEKSSFKYPGPILRFPLKIGEWWRYDYEAESATYGKHILTPMTAQYEVKSYEQITVTAGTFWTFRIEVERYTRKGRKNVGSYTYWYAPSVKRIIKHTEGKGTELIEYKIQ